jgi:signal transduction histidine kinase
MQISLDQKNIKVTNDVKDEIAVGNPDNIEQIITILLDNAIKYSEPKKSIEIVSKKNKNAVMISIIDHGIGIKKEDLPYIYDRFYRGETARTRSAINGHGLGLSLAKQLAKRTGADIHYEPTPKGGSTFVLRIQA